MITIEDYQNALSFIHNSETNKRLNFPDFNSDAAHAECNARIFERTNKMNNWLEKTGRMPPEVVILEVIS